MCSRILVLTSQYIHGCSGKEIGQVRSLPLNGENRKEGRKEHRKEVMQVCDDVWNAFWMANAKPWETRNEMK